MGAIRSGFPAFRCYLFGVDVTLDVASYTPTWTDGRSPGTLNLSLVSKGSKYIITERDLEAIYGDLDLDAIMEDAARLSDLGVPNAALEAAFRAVDERLDEVVGDVTKREILKVKIRQRLPNVVTPEISDTVGLQRQTGLSGMLALRGEAARYHLAEGEAIFHANDSLVLFERDAFSFEWFWGFSGFGTIFNTKEDANGGQFVNVIGEDALRILRRARITFNPGIGDYKYIKSRFDDEVRLWYKQPLANMTLPEIAYFLVFGTDYTPEISPREALSGAQIPEYLHVGINGSSTSAATTDGAGTFNYHDSQVYIFGPEQPAGGAAPTTLVSSDASGKQFQRIDSLAAWQAAVDHKVYASDLETKILPGYETQADEFIAQSRRQVLGPNGLETVVDMEAVIDIIGRNPQLYPVDFGRLMVLIPGSLGPGVNRDILLRDLIQGPATHTTFSTRYAQLLDIANKIEFSLYATPRGDILLEMPLYDFDPEEFGTEPIAPPTAFTSKFPDEKRGPFTPRYVLALEDIIEHDSSFDDERVRTMMIVPYHLMGLEATGLSKQVWAEPGIAMLDHLIPQYGIRSEEAEPASFIRSKEAASVYAHLKLNLWNSDARNASVPIVPRLGIGPNRPLYFEQRHFVGTCRSVARSMVWNSSYASTLGVNYIRRWDGQVDQFGRRIYSPVGGFGGRPLNYSLLFAGHRVPTLLTSADTREQQTQPEANTPKFASTTVPSPIKTLGQGSREAREGPSVPSGDVPLTRLVASTSNSTGPAAKFTRVLTFMERDLRIACADLAVRIGAYRMLDDSTIEVTIEPDVAHIRPDDNKNIAAAVVSAVRQLNSPIVERVKQNGDVVRLTLRESSKA